MSVSPTNAIAAVAAVDVELADAGSSAAPSTARKRTMEERAPSSQDVGGARPVSLEYDDASVWAPAWLRFESKANALAFRARQVVVRAEDRGVDTPDVSSRGKALYPFGALSKDGELSWNEDKVRAIKALGKLK